MVECKRNSLVHEALKGTNNLQASVVRIETLSARQILKR